MAQPEIIQVRTVETASETGTVRAMIEAYGALPLRQSAVDQRHTDAAGEIVDGQAGGEIVEATQDQIAAADGSRA